MNDIEITRPYYVQIQIEGSDSIYYGEGNTLDEARHVALHAFVDVKVKSQQVWVYSEELSI